MTRLAALLAALLWLGAAQAIVFEKREFASPAEEARYRQITAELRCLVCQNQSISESDADLAADLRDQVYAMMREGKDDRAIIDYMVDRYGNFVLYRPPLSPATMALWAGPFVLAVLGVIWLLRVVRRGRGSVPPPLTDEERARLAAALGGDERK
ncbi:MAG: cytochrome c-type biogenesis protein [Gammaproteobacteria bacterium]